VPSNRYIAFLRGMNLGNRRLPMSKLKSLFGELGFEDVETFIASGNVVFSAKSGDVARLEERISKHLEAALGYNVDTFIRAFEEVARITKSKLFPDDGQANITIHVTFLEEKLPASVARRLESIDTGYDLFRVKGREFYWLCRGRMSDSKVWTLPELKQLKLPNCTMRNITSLRKLVAKHGA
jgi:uncharacterized protein (DUF1697 family)